jgi:LPS export ABC transporter protein LptC
MTKWQRWARLLVAIFAVGFAVMVAFAFKRRVPVVPAGSSGRTDPNAVVESTTGRVMKFSGAHEDVTVEYQKQSIYKDGASSFQGVRVTIEERDGKRTFVITAKEALVGANESTITMNGDVTMTASDGLVVRSEHATYTEADAMVRVPGPVEFARKRLTGSGVGMTYDKNLDVLVILDQAHVLIASDTSGSGTTDITSPTATVARRDKYLRFERGIKALRGGQVIEADNGLAHLKDDEEHIESIELRGNSRITESKAGVGSLQALGGRDMDLKYGADGETLEHALIVGDAVLQIAGQPGAAGRQIIANLLDMTLAPDGTTPVALKGRDAVQLTFPADPGGPTRVIKGASLDASGEPTKGLTHAQFTGEVDYRERDTAVPRAAKAETMDLALKPGMSSIDDATFTRNVRFSQEGGLFATAAAGRYVLEKGTLELHGTEPGAARPHVSNEQIDVEANKIDVILAGPIMKAAGDVKSLLQPAKKDGKSKEIKMPSMLKADKPVNITAGDLDYDGTLSKATYQGKPKLWQGDTTIQGDELTIDNKSGDLHVAGSPAATRTMLEQGDKTDKTKTKKERVRSIGTSKDFKYEESSHRATYTGDAHLSGPQGDMTADKIELYLKPSGDEIDRAEAYGAMTLREQNRTTTGERLTYTTSNETYLITGLPVTILDECGRPTEGQTLTFVQATDTVNIDGGDEIRTRTKGGGTCR